MPIRRLQAAVLLAFIALLAGCASDKAGRGGGHPSSPDAFDRAGDPPITADTHCAAGQLAEAGSDWAGAIAQYQAALKSDPKNLQALYQLGVLQTRLHEFGDGEQTWTRYIALTPDKPTGYANLGYCQELAGDPTAAAATYAKGVAVDPHDEPCHVNYGLMLARQGRTDAARTQLAAVLQPAEVYYDLGSVAEQRGQPQVAADNYRQALALDPTMTDAQARLSVLEAATATRPASATQP